MKRSGQISLLVILSVIITTLTFCDKKRSPEPVESSPSKGNAINSAMNSTASGNTTSRNTGVSNNSSAESLIIQLVTTGGSTTSKDSGTPDDPSGSQNTLLNVSTLLPGWTFDPCLLNPLQLTGKNGTTVVILTFGSAIANGNYTLTSGLPGIGQVKMTVLDPPGQPIGSLFVSKTGGTVSVNVGTSTTVAAFTSVQCTPLLFPYPVVTVSGDVGCN